MTSYLLDTNLLARSLDATSPSYIQAASTISKLLADKEQVYVTAQNLVELWSVVTRPLLANGFGWDTQRAELEVDNILNRFQLLEDTSAIFNNWLQLVTAHGITGKRVHDTRLVAVMQTHGITHLLTYNTQDFKVYSNITLVHPGDVI
jgi:predicted nucleic acid-binding protein